MVFRDLLRQKSDSGDSTKGLFYASRMQLFRKDNKVAPSETAEMLIRPKSIMKPIEFEKEKEEISRLMNKYQFSNILKIKPRAIQPVIEKNTEPEDDAFRLAAKIISNIVIFHPKDAWKLEEHGGVKMWVNAKTGEVSLENPNQNKSNAKSRRASINNRRGSIHRRESTIGVLRRSSTCINPRRGSDICTSSNKELQDMYEILDPKSTLRLTVLGKEF